MKEKIEKISTHFKIVLCIIITFFVVKYIDYCPEAFKLYQLTVQWSCPELVILVFFLAVIHFTLQWIHEIEKREFLAMIMYDL